MRELTVLEMLGLNQSQRDNLYHVVRTATRLRDAIVKRNSSTKTGNYFLTFVDRAGMTPYVIAKSKEIPREIDSVILYNRAILHLGLPETCMSYFTIDRDLKLLATLKGQDLEELRERDRIGDFFAEDEDDTFEDDDDDDSFGAIENEADEWALDGDEDDDDWD